MTHIAQYILQGLTWGMSYKLASFCGYMFNFTRFTEALHRENKENSAQTTVQPSGQTNSVQKKRPCCVCKETRLARDICISSNGEENCSTFIDAHNQCLIAENFHV